MQTQVLLVEDDAVSRAFLAEALASLPARVDAAVSIAAALAFASRQAYSLWLVDAHLPDGSGTDCLLALRRLQPTVPALAITAEAHRDEFDALCAAGFIEVLQKPISVAALLAPLRRALGQQAETTSICDSGKRPTWDEAQALLALGGNRETLAVLRRLFIGELPVQTRRVHEACSNHDAGAARAELHKLKASCGFVGAARLLQAVQALADFPLDPGRLTAFEFAIADTLTAHS